MNEGGKRDQACVPPKCRRIGKIGRFSDPLQPYPSCNLFLNAAADMAHDGGANQRICADGRTGYLKSMRIFGTFCGKKVEP
jgi:hypothetical protein